MEKGKEIKIKGREYFNEIIAKNIPKSGEINGHTSIGDITNS
jgi:hypothetical protein